MTPKNKNGVPIEPSDYNRSDGFSPGQPIVLKVPGLDTPAAMAQTGAVPVTDLARTYDRHAPIVVINARTGHRQLIWAELDSNATSPATTDLIIHPGKNFREGERYIVALRNLRGADGKKLDGRPRLPALPRRDQDRLPGVRAAPLAHGVDLQVAPARGHRPPRPLPRVGLHRGRASASLSERMLSIRDRAFADLGDHNLKNLRVEGVSPQVHDRQGDRLHAGRSSRTWPAGWRAT